jgi:hypothetical protein
MQASGDLSSDAMELMLGRCSFSPDTKVLLADGSTKPIKDVEVGDVVVATDPEQGKTTGKPVTRLYDHLDTDLADVTVTDRSGVKSVLHTTQDHPFWDATTANWTPAGSLRPGDRLSTPTGTATVADVRSFSGARHMLNLTVAGIHTYYVLAGRTPVLVHNVTVPCAQVGLADAASNISSTSGKMSGVLYADMDDAPYYVTTGFRNREPGYIGPPGAKSGFEDHLEA